MSGRGAPEGNQNAKKGKLFHDELRKALIQDDLRRLRAGIEVLMDKAAEGDRFAIELIRDTMDGKPKQQMEVSGEDGAPLTVQIVRFDTKE